jgi:hypothetical protein
MFIPLLFMLPSLGAVSGLMVLSIVIFYVVLIGVFILSVVIALRPAVAWNVLAKMSRYEYIYEGKSQEIYQKLAGLKLFIQTADENRLQMLQGANTASLSDDQVRDLYDKMLPWAAVFGLTKEWSKTLKIKLDADGLLMSSYTLQSCIK